MASNKPRSQKPSSGDKPRARAKASEHNFVLGAEAGRKPLRLRDDGGGLSPGQKSFRILAAVLLLLLFIRFFPKKQGPQSTAPQTEPQAISNAGPGAEPSVPTHPLAVQPARAAAGPAASTVKVGIERVPAFVRSGAAAKIRVAWEGVNPEGENLTLRIHGEDKRLRLKPVSLEKTFSLLTPRGNSDFTIDVPLDSSEGSCQVLAYVAPIGAGWKNRSAEAQTAPGAIQVRSPVGVRAFPESVLAGEAANVRVAWNEIDASKYDLFVKVSNFIHRPGDLGAAEPIFVEKRYDLPSNDGEMGFALPVPASTRGGRCYVYAYVGSKGEGWKARIGESKTVNQALTLIPRVAIKSYPPEIRSGVLMPVEVAWNKVDKSQYWLVLKLSNYAENPGSNPIWVENGFELPSDSGSQAFDFKVPGGIPSDRCYILAYLASRKNGWEGRLADTRTPDSALAVAGQ